MAKKNLHGLYQVDNPVREPESRVLTSAHLFTGRPGGWVDDAAVVIEGDRIAWVGREAELPTDFVDYPRQAHTDATITPGFVETHAHLGGFAYNFDPDVPDPQRHDQGWHALASLAPARQLASVGVTTVQSLGARNFADVVLREAIEQHLVDGPRIVASGAQLTTSGGHSWITGGEVDSVTEIKKKVRDHHKAGVDVIKVMATGGFQTGGSAPWNAQFTTEELRALVEEAHRLGKHVAAHAHGTQGIRRAAEAGVNYIAHTSFISEDGITRFDDKLAEMLAQTGTFVDTNSPPSYPAIEGETMAPHAKRLYDHGVNIVLGNDIGAVFPPSFYPFAMQQLVKSGLPVEEVLVAATSRGAAAVGLAGVVGVLEPGYQADLLVLNGDLRDDISVAADIEEVIIRGETFNRLPIEPFDITKWPADGSLELKREVGGLEARAAWVEKQTKASLT